MSSRPRGPAPRSRPRWATSLPAAARVAIGGGLLAWAVVEVILINKQTEDTRPTGPFETRKEIIAVVASLVVFGAIAGVHYWFGYPAFG